MFVFGPARRAGTRLKKSGPKNCRTARDRPHAWIISAEPAFGSFPPPARLDKNSRLVAWIIFRGRPRDRTHAWIVFAAGAFGS